MHQLPTSTQQKLHQAMAINSNIVSIILILILTCHSLDQANCELKILGSAADRASREPNDSHQCKEQCEQKCISCVNTCYLSFKDYAKMQECCDACEEENKDCQSRC